MARNFLGNLKGPQGPKGDTGPKGEDGGFNNETIGVQNLLDLPNAYGEGGYGEHSYDNNSGVINYTSIATRFNIPFYVPENTEFLTFNIKDYDIAVNEGVFRFRLQEVDGSVLTNYTSVDKNVPIKVDVSGLSGKLIFAVHTGSTGSFEKPMLVEGDVPVLWNAYNPTTFYCEYRMFETPIPSNVETKLRPYFLGGDNLENVDSELVVTQGVWLINWNFYINNQNGDVRLRLYKDGELIADKLSSDGYENLSRLISVKSGSSQLRFTVQNMGDNELTMSTAIRNNMQLKKL